VVVNERLRTESDPQGLKPICFATLAARLKPCPSPTDPECPEQVERLIVGIDWQLATDH